MLKIIIGPKRWAHAAWKQYDARWMLSIQDAVEVTDPVPTPSAIPSNQHVHFFFDDIVLGEEGHPSSHKSNVYRGAPPTPEDVEKMLTFARTVPDDAIMYVHCFAGVSRSAATTFAIFCDRLGPGKEEEAMELTAKSAPLKGIWPSDRIVKYADDYLGRHGKMEHVVKAYKEKVLLRERSQES